MNHFVYTRYLALLLINFKLFQALYTVFRKKHPLKFFFGISMNDVWI